MKNKKTTLVSSKKIWGLARADKAISDYVIARDEHCQFPGCFISEGLTCSHYRGRAYFATRFDPDNLIALCRKHHYWDKQLGWEYQKQQQAIHGWDGKYTLFMKDKLGTKFDELMKRPRISKTKAIEELIHRLSTVSVLQ